MINPDGHHAGVPVYTHKGVDAMRIFLSNGVVEGFSAKAELTTRKPYGFRTYHGLEVALYHAHGALPEPKFMHRFS